MSIVLEMNDLSKRYGSIQALDHIILQIEAGKIYGLLGRNGAGKTTLLNLITSRIYTNEGRFSLFGEPGTDNAGALARICYMPEKNLFPINMRVSELLDVAEQFYAHFDRPYALDLCRQFQLDLRKKYKALSRGYESILRIVMGMASRAEITIFDEPVLGLDAAVRDQFYQALIRDYSENPRTFILSTHLIDESADIFEDVIMLKEGKVITCEPAEKLRRSALHISGRADAAENFIREQNIRILNREAIGQLASYAIQGPLSPEQRDRAIAAGLDLAPVSLQKLFIYMTESEERQV